MADNDWFAPIIACRPIRENGDHWVRTFDGRNCCARCRVRLPLAEFYPELAGWCKACCEILWHEMQAKANSFPSDEQVISIRRRVQARQVRGANLTGFEKYVLPEWGILRRKRFDLAGFACEYCRTKSARLTLHHLTYERVGTELLDDVRVLCPRCHSKADKERRRQELENGYPKMVLSPEPPCQLVPKRGPLIFRDGRERRSRQHQTAIKC